MLYCHCCWQTFFLLMNSQFCCEIRQLWWNKFIKLSQDQIEFDKILDERNIYPILSKERPGAYGISLNLRGALIREGALLREGSLQNYSGNHCENHQTQYNKSFEYFSLTINYQLFTNKKSEIKYTHDNVVFFYVYSISMSSSSSLYESITRSGSFSMFSERINKLFGCFSHCSFQPF